MERGLYMKTPKIKLSQCMIVKNEEKNIRQALSWAKEIAFEQIVVDTGSTDRTVEIAQELGAKVYHFEWKNDFASAKNFALEQASGNWIAFLDADEYFRKEDISYLLEYIQQIINYNKNAPQDKQVYLLRLPCLHLNDDGKVFGSSTLDRIFQNRPWIRYQNKIHENLCSTNSQFPLYHIIGDERLPIYHTGYARKVFENTKKAERNIMMIKKELEENSESALYWSYLGDSYQANKQKDLAEQAWKKSLELDDPQFDTKRKMDVIASLLRIYIDQPEKKGDFENLYESYCIDGQVNADIEYWMSCYCMLHTRYAEAIEHLQQVLDCLLDIQNANSSYSSGRLVQIYKMLMQANNIVGNKSEVVRYAVQSLQGDNKQEDVLIALLCLFQQAHESSEGVYGFLSKLYDFRDLRDVLFVIKCAKLADYPIFVDYAYAQIPKKEKERFGITE